MVVSRQGFLSFLCCFINLLWSEKLVFIKLILYNLKHYCGLMYSRFKLIHVFLKRTCLPFAKWALAFYCKYYFPLLNFLFQTVTALFFSMPLSGSWYRWESGNSDFWRILCVLQNDVFETRPLSVAFELQWQERSSNCGRTGSVFEGGTKGIIRLLNWMFT